MYYKHILRCVYIVGSFVDRTNSNNITTYHYNLPGFISRIGSSLQISRVYATDFPSVFSLSLQLRLTHQTFINVITTN